ncbi:MAG: RNA 2',3'-cyclic phosphodiesterase [Sphingomonas sp.]
MLRLFVGLRPPPPIRAQLLSLMAGLPGARWQDDEQLHLTLRFIGEVDGRTADDVALAMGTIRAPAIAVSLSGVGRFDSKGRTNAVWAGVAPQEALAALHRKVDHALVRLGLAAEHRAYLPHITLARFARSEVVEGEIDAFLARQAGLASAPFTLHHIMLFASHLGRSGAQYEALGRWPLA